MEDIIQEPNDNKEKVCSEVLEILSNPIKYDELVRYFRENTDEDSGIYDFSGSNRDDVYSRTAAILIFLAYPTIDTEMHILPENCDFERQRMMFNIYHRLCLPTRYIELKPGDFEGKQIEIDGYPSIDAKQERVNKLGLSDYIEVIEPILTDETSQQSL